MLNLIIVLAGYKHHHAGTRMLGLNYFTYNIEPKSDQNITQYVSKYEQRHANVGFLHLQNKAADQLCGNRTADQRLCFRYIDIKYYSTIPLLPIYEITSLVCVGPGLKPRKPFSHTEVHIIHIILLLLSNFLTLPSSCTDSDARVCDYAGVFHRVLRKIQRKVTVPMLLERSLILNTSTCMQYVASLLTVK